MLGFAIGIACLASLVYDLPDTLLAALSLKLERSRCKQHRLRRMWLSDRAPDTACIVYATCSTRCDCSPFPVILKVRTNSRPTGRRSFRAEQ